MDKMWLISALAALIGFWSLQFIWSRRKLYWFSWCTEGPLAFPFVGNALIFANYSNVMRSLESIGNKYRKGFRFWLGTRLIYGVLTPELCEALINSPHAMDKGNVYQFVSDSMGGPGLITSSGNEWKVHRKIMNPSIQNFKILNSFYPIFNRNLRVLIDVLDKQTNDELFDVYHVLEKCSLDMICETTFGAKTNVQNGENLEFLEQANVLMQLCGMVIVQPWLQIKWIFERSEWYERSQKCRRIARSFSENLIDKKIAEFKANGSLKEFDNTIDADYGTKKVNNFVTECVRMSQQDSQGFSREDMINESLTLILGGYETTATSVAYIVLMLAMYPKLQERVFEEINSIIPGQLSDVTAEHIGRLDYTNRFIKESMRLNPTVPYVGRVAKEDMDICGMTFPKGTELMICIFNMHRHQDIWGPKSKEFDPDHFLPENLAEKHPYSFIPFSAGSRNCIGLKYGQIVVRLFVCWLVRNYCFTTPLKLSDMNYQMNVALKLKNGHMVRAYRRTCS